MGNGSAPPQVRSRASQRLLPKTIDKINYVESFNILKQGNVNKYIDLMSHEKLIETRVKIKNKSSQFSSALQSNESIYSILANMFQSITTKGLITPQILGYIDKEIKGDQKDNILSNLENYANIFSDGEFSYIDSDLYNVMCYKEKSFVSKIYGGVKTKNYNTSNFLNFSGQNIKRVFLYRQDLEDRILSKFFAQETGMYKTWQGYDYSDVEFTYTDDHWWVVYSYINEQRQLFNMYDCCEWDHVVKYENLTGDPVVDLQPMFDRDLKPLPENFKKLLGKKEKIDRTKNYKEFKTEFDRICKKLGVKKYGKPQ